jgi:hypothetical protein
MKSIQKGLWIGFLLITVLLAFWWVTATKRENPPTKVAPTPVSQIRNDSHTPTKVGGPASSAKPPPRTAFMATEAFIRAFRTPIAFFGRVIDQHGDPVSGADVKLSANDNAFGGRPSEYARRTDGDGRFLIEGIVGITLAVEVSKPGYRSIPPDDSKVTSSGLFEYGLSSIKGPHRPDANAPVIFTLLWGP